LFAFAFFKEAAAIREPMLDSLDRLLEDPQLLALSTQALASRSPRSNKAGREGIAPDRLLRCVVLKHLKGWSFRELHRELRASLLYRRFCRFFEDPIPDFSNLCRAFALFGKEGTPADSSAGHPASAKSLRDCRKEAAHRYDGSRN
jgi:hypothetical protein